MKHFELNSDNVFFTSDLHFFHKKIIEYCDRPFSNTTEMNNILIDNWNSVVPEDATVFVLGDMSFRDFNQTAPLINKLNGKIILIKGNHDHWNPEKILETYDMVSVTVLDLKEEGSGLVYCHLSHFPLLEWDRMHHGSINLHGHCHGSLDEIDKHNCKRLDVGVDSHNWKPISWDEIMRILNRRNLKK